MKQALFVSILIFIVSGGFNSYAIEGVTNLENKLYEKNQELQALKLQIESSSALLISSRSAFYPTLDAVAGREENKTDETLTPERGNVLFLEGKLNLFKGFRDVSVKNQRNIELEVAKLELESKKRELKLKLTEALSQMAYVHMVQKILEDEYKLTQSQKQMASRKVSAGLTSQADNYEFELRENEIQFERKQIDQFHTEAHESLNQLFGENISDDDIKNIDFSSFEKLSQKSVDVKPEQTIEFRLAELARLKAESERAEAKSDFMPSVDFSYAVGRITPAQNNMQYIESKYAIHLTLPLFSGFETYYKTKSATLLSQAADRRKQQTRINTTAEINILKSKILELGTLFQLNEKRLQSAQKYFDITLTEYKRGVKNSPDLVGATERLYSSKKRKIEVLKELESLTTRVSNLTL